METLINPLHPWSLGHSLWKMFFFEDCFPLLSFWDGRIFNGVYQTSPAPWKFSHHVLNGWRTNTFWSFREFHHPNKGTIFESGLDFHLSFYIRRFLLSTSWGRMTSIDSTQLMFFLGKKLDLPKAQRLGVQSFQWWHSKLLKLKTCSIFHVFWHQVSCLFLIPSHRKHIYIYITNCPWIISKTSTPEFHSWIHVFWSSLNCLSTILQFSLLPLGSPMSSSKGLGWMNPVITGSPCFRETGAWRWCLNRLPTPWLFKPSNFSWTKQTFKFGS